MEVLIRQLLLLGLLLLLVHAHKTYGFQRTYGLHRIDRGAAPLSPDYGIHALNRSSFPPGFIFGAAAAAYQIEGGWNLDGKGQSVWDNFTHTYPEKIKDHSNGDVACDSINRYKEDIMLLKNMNADAYRFSISWTRVLPSGKYSGGINEKGIQYYNNLIDELLANGLQPAVTIFHWDTPQALQDEYGGWLNETIIKDFHDYADLCFKRFGDRVKLWITLNEPTSITTQSYDSGAFPPNRCSGILYNCTSGNSSTEPYIAAHNLLLAHAHAVNLYRTKYQKLQKGTIGISIPGLLPVPLSNSSEDHHASLRYLEFNFGWFMNPLVYGDYPTIMRDLVRERLPKFSPSQSQLLKGSIDFLGFNYYTGAYVGNLALPPELPPEYNSFTLDMRCNISYVDLNGNLIGEKFGSEWLHFYPIGLWKYLHYLKHKYNNPIIYITENGVDELNDPKLPLEAVLKDNFRIKYYFKHLAFLKEAIDNGVRVKGYFGWSILDNFEWLSGYSVRFGINYVNFKTLERYPKLSAQWFQRFLQKKRRT